MWQTLILIAIALILLSIIVEAVQFLVWVGVLALVVVGILYLLNKMRR
ncbi:hypothetical protein [Flaviflexus ciconiae]|nr:hypothetical protein [Flaviflexus ciconiae]